MFGYALLVTGLIGLQYLISHLLMSGVYRFFYLPFRAKNLAIRLLLVVFLPGTIVHELSHFLAATVLGVRTGTINLLPKIQEDNQVIAGETQIARCDPIRYSLIGVAPFFIGLLGIYSIFKYLVFEPIGVFYNHQSALALFGSVINNPTPLILVSIIMIFWITNTMFSSKKDLEMIIVPLGLLYIIGFVLYFADIRLDVFAGWFNSLTGVLQELSRYQILVLGVNLIALSFFSLANRLWLLVFRRRLV
jgi:hypothetical protein